MAAVLLGGRIIFLNDDIEGRIRSGNFILYLTLSQGPTCLKLATRSTTVEATTRLGAVTLEPAG